MTSYALHLDGATKVSTGKYKWSFGHTNTHRPASVKLGPVSVTCPTNQRNVTILSDTFQNDAKSHTLRGNLLQETIYTVFPDQKYVHSATPAVEGGGGGAAVTEADIEALPEVQLFFNMGNDYLLDSNYNATTGVGSDVRYIYSKTDNTMVFTGYQNWQVANFGDNGALGLVSDANWQYGIDSVQPNVWSQDKFTIMFAMRAPADMSSRRPIFDFYSARLNILGGVLEMTDSTGQNVLVPQGGLVPTKDYLITFKRADAKHWITIERLDISGSIVGPVEMPIGSAYNIPAQWKLSTAQEHFLNKTGILSYLIGWGGTEASEIETARSWIKLKYSGGAAEEAEEAAAINVYQLYDRRVETIELSRPHKSLDEITLEFRGDDNALFDPTACALSLAVTTENRR